MDSPYITHPLAPGFWRIEENGVRCFLLEGEGEALLIDAGFGSGDLRAHIAQITPYPVTRVILTHSDGDHTGCISQFEDVYMHPAEFSRYAKNGGDTARLHPLWEGEVVTIGQRSFTVLLLSGHTPGSIGLLDYENRILISGDVVAEVPIYLFGEGRSLPAYAHSIARLASLSHTFDAIYPSHGTIPLSPSILPELEEGARLLMAGCLPDSEPDRPLPCRLYRWKRCGYLYQP